VRRLPATYRLFLAVAPGPAARTSGVFFRAKLGNPRAVVAAEVVYPPFAYALVFKQVDIGSGGEITSWTSAPLGASTTVAIDLTVAFTHTAFPSDGRTLAQIEADRAEAPECHEPES
jgi:hypothetical protein